MGLITTAVSQLSSTFPEDIRLIFLCAFVITTIVSGVLLYQKKNSKRRPLPAKLANNKQRKWGHWTPEDYKFPIPPPIQGWDINTTQPIPYRAFKHKYNVTMGIRNMKSEDWIELDNEWPKFHNLKLERIQKKGTDVYGTLPEAYAPAMELLEEFRNYLPARYPTLFQKTKEGIKNLYNGEEFNTVNPTMDPMLIAAHFTQDDLAIMVEDSNGEYVLKGGAIMLAGFWRFKDKVNLPLSAIHTTGDVPKYNTHLKKGMEKFFQRITPEAPIVRNNYFIQTDDRLDWSSSIGDENKQNVGWYTADKATDINQIWYRSERQSVRRLPLTGACVFTIRTYFIPMVEMCKEPHVPQRLLSGIESWSDDVREYRGYSVFADVLLPYLREKAAEQAEAGFTKETDPENYPM
ncbi:CYFA0S07e02234g1_1 [Cyberlindnera fabianii]|uniref:CYFA0S07e02234g1_1 n=2 Tax=Cyberlindnera fabianii TaxID=36022 RepID=A0A061AW82_CYBFA|nr:CYFA0S07e02234g1_1 [Cyberlindnera fabianii]